MNFILTSLGSGGDVYPFIWMGKLLLERGHSVTLLAAAVFQEPAERAGVKFVAIGTEDDYHRLTANPDVWHPVRGPELIFDATGRGVRLYYDAILALRPGRGTVLLASSLALGSRLAREKLGLKMITVHLQPSTFLSAYDMPVLASGMEWLCKLPLFLRKLLYRLPNPLEKKMAPYLRQICREEKVRMPKRILSDWWNSPDGVIGFFPAWFAAPAPDWPTETLLPGFPLYDLGDQSELPPELATFLAAGEKPVLFTAGTAMKHGHRFFETAVQACQLSGLRALLVTKHPEQLPAVLPAHVLHCSYLPFSQVLTHCAVLVSHGGIGTISQGLAAGVPQLLMPMSHDQPDNLNRLRRLGVGEGLYPDQFTPEKVADILQRLLGDFRILNACGYCARKIAEADTAAVLVKFLEREGKGL